MNITTIGSGNVGGGLDKARALEDHLTMMMMALNQAGLGRFFYRYAPPGEL